MQNSILYIIPEKSPNNSILFALFLVRSEAFHLPSIFDLLFCIENERGWFLSFARKSEKTQEMGTCFNRTKTELLLCFGSSIDWDFL